ncbi:MAG TPA: hypothetical protein VM261_23485 [Kofleriaceae bacterium]|nr:hypothetical protein [Kofleriaceae bacterium]
MLRRGLVALVVTAAAASVISAAGCSSKKSEGLPPAQDWQSPPEGAGSMPSMQPNPHAGGRIDPHAGVAGAPPLGGSMGGGGAAGGDPHAGVEGAPPLGGGGGHGAGGGVDVAAMGLPEPDPNRPMDPNKVLTGTVALGAAHAGKVPAGSVIFLAVRQADPSTGQGVGMPMATDKLVVGAAWPLTFRIDESKAMIGGTGFSGDVVVMARFDQDEEARSKQPGDIVGQVRTQIPAQNLSITLDQVLQ